MTVLLPLLAFLFASLVVAGCAMAMSSRPTTIERRLSEIAAFGSAEVKSDESDYGRAVVDVLKRVGTVAPRSEKEMGKLQQRLLAAGYRSNEAMIVFFGIRVACALAAFDVSMSPFITRPNLAMAIAA